MKRQLRPGPDRFRSRPRQPLCSRRLTLDGASKDRAGELSGLGRGLGVDRPLSDRRGPPRRVRQRRQHGTVLAQLDRSRADRHHRPRASTTALSIVPGRGMPHLRVGGMPAFGSLVSPHTRARQRLFALADDVAISKGSHLLKMGALVEQFETLIDFQIFWTGPLQLSGHRPVPAGASLRAVSRTYPDPIRFASSRARSSGVYAQDDVKTVTRPDTQRRAAMGVRHGADEAEGRLVTLQDPLHDTAPPDRHAPAHAKANFAPRVGLTWTPDARWSAHSPNRRRHLLRHQYAAVRGADRRRQSSLLQPGDGSKPRLPESRHLPASTGAQPRCAVVTTGRRLAWSTTTWRSNARCRGRRR